MKKKQQKEEKAMGSLSGPSSMGAQIVYWSNASLRTGQSTC
tara:strand:+ start:414 stop:536 length:123 start_codon:yes stop_codon:yes gene_type:complete